MNKRKKTFFVKKSEIKDCILTNTYGGGVNFLVRTISGTRYEITDSQCRGEKP